MYTDKHWEEGESGCWKATSSLATESMDACFKNNIKKHSGTSLVVQWLRIHLPMQGTQVRSMVWEDPTCQRATKPMNHNY